MAIVRGSNPWPILREQATSGTSGKHTGLCNCCERHPGAQYAGDIDRHVSGWIFPFLLLSNTGYLRAAKTGSNLDAEPKFAHSKIKTLSHELS